MMKESLLIKPLSGGCKLILENLLGCRTMLLNHPSVRPRKGNRHTRKSAQNYGSVARKAISENQLRLSQCCCRHTRNSVRTTLNPCLPIRSP
jgi:hypothetical protein